MTNGMTAAGRIPKSRVGTSQTAILRPFAFSQHQQLASAISIGNFEFFAFVDFLSIPGRVVLTFAVRV